MAEENSHQGDPEKILFDVPKEPKLTYNREEMMKIRNDLDTVQQDSTHRYSREEMLKIRESAFCRTRPEYLSRKFDNEDGVFSPDKWLQHQWLCEGVENRTAKRKPNSQSCSVNKVVNSILEAAAASSAMNNDLDQQTILSPQRRGFSSGCRAPSPHVNESEKQQSSKSRWKHGHSNTNGMDFKPAFQKSALEATSRSSRSGSSHNATSSGGSWNVFGSKQGGNEKFGGNRRAAADRGRTTTERTRSTNTDNEPVPEWMDEGPVSVMDIIELKGFDDDPQTTEKKRRRSKCKESNSRVHNDNKRTGSPNRRQKRYSGGCIADSSSQTIINTSRPSSRQTPQSIRSFSGDVEKDVSVKQKQNGSRPNSLASIMPMQFIQASDLESSIIREQQQKQQQKTENIGEENKQPFNLFSVLGMVPTNPEKAENISMNNNNNNEGDNFNSKLPESDAELAAVVLGIPFEQLAKAVDPSGAALGLETTKMAISQQPRQQPSSSRLSRFFTKTSSADTKGSSSTSPISIKEMEDAQLNARFDMLTLQAQLDQQQQQVRKRGSAAASPLQPPPSFLMDPQQRPPSATTNFALPVQQQMRTSPLQQFNAGVQPGFQPPSSIVPRPSSASPLLPPQQIPSPFASSGQFQRISPLQSLMQQPPQRPNPNISTDLQYRLYALAKKLSGDSPNIQPDANSLRIAWDMLMRDPAMCELARTAGRMGSGVPVASSSSKFVPLQPPPNPYPAPPPHFGYGSGYMPYPPPPAHHFGLSHPRQQHPQAVHPLQVQHPSGSFYGPPMGNMPPSMPPPGPFHQQQPYHHHPQKSMPPPLHFPPSSHAQFPPSPHPQFPPPLLVNNANHNHITGNNNPRFSGQQQFNPPVQNLLNSPAFMPTSVMRQMSKVPGSGSGGEAGSGSSTGGDGRVPILPVLQKMFDLASGPPAPSPVDRSNGLARAILGRGPEEAEPIVTDQLPAYMQNNTTRRS